MMRECLVLYNIVLWAWVEIVKFGQHYGKVGQVGRLDGLVSQWVTKVYI